MKLVTRHVHNFFYNRWVDFFGAIASILALVLGIYTIISDQNIGATRLWLFGIGFVLFFVFLGTSIYSIRIRQENRALRNMMKRLHRINHEYRDILSKTFQLSPLEAVKEARMRNELTMLKAACQKIAKIYSDLAHCDCMATVKLISKGADGRFYCETYARSEENCSRDGHIRRQFELNTGKNTALDRALACSDGAISFFHSADLTSELDYRNERDQWFKFYQSVIVVAIRCIIPNRLGTKEFSDDIGFLVIDTLSPHRLNDGWHVELLAAFADQMYNFMSLMRGKYVLPGSETASSSATH